MKNKKNQWYFTRSLIDIIAQLTFGYLLIWVIAYGVTQSLGYMPREPLALQVGLVTGGLFSAIISFVIWTRYRKARSSLMAAFLALVVVFNYSSSAYAQNETQDQLCDKLRPSATRVIQTFGAGLLLLPRYSLREYNAGVGVCGFEQTFGIDPLNRHSFKSIEIKISAHHSPKAAQESILRYHWDYLNPNAYNKSTFNSSNDKGILILRNEDQSKFSTALVVRTKDHLKFWVSTHKRVDDGQKLSATELSGTTQQAADLIYRNLRTGWVAPNSPKTVLPTVPPPLKPVPTLTKPEPDPPEMELKVQGIEIFDANALYTSNGRNLPKNLSRQQLLNLKRTRKGTSADGVSQLIIRLEFDQNIGWNPLVLNGPGNGSIAPLFDPGTLVVGERYFAYFLYTPPQIFDENIPSSNRPKSSLSPPPMTIEAGLGARKIQIKFAAVDVEENPVRVVDFILTKPPVVLVHGLFSDPVQTWIESFENGRSMTALLERAGFVPFLVNYQDTNGIRKSPPSSFAANRRVVWDSPRFDYTPFKYDYGFFGSDVIQSELQKPETTRIGGISQALTFYRDELDIAATQAMVVGHSMGGILARVWASKNYNPNYKRAENFMQGDIDRLLTLNTPHHGSELMELKDALETAEIKGESWLEWGRRHLTNTAIWWYIDDESAAITDLRPQSEALQRIGTTHLPSYAIATQADTSQLGARDKDPYNYYNSLYAVGGAVFFNNRPLLDNFIQTRFQQFDDDALDETGRATYKRIVSENIDHNAYFWAKRRDADYNEELYRTIKNTIKIPFGLANPGMGNDGELDLLSPSVLASKVATGSDLTTLYDETRVNDLPETFLETLRAVIFHQDVKNDGAVRVVSQIGGTEATETLDGVVHSYAAWDKMVQQRVLFLLQGQADRFSEDGFPEAGQLTPRYAPSKALSDSRVYGEEAIAWSGMVKSHAEQYRQVADQQHTLILVRPVNPDSTILLEKNAAAKGMNIKGKSSNWGPQVGYIPVKQRYSKLWRVLKAGLARDAEIKKYDGEVQKSLATFYPEIPERKYAVEKNLEKMTQKGLCQVLTLKPSADAEKDILFQCDNKFYHWNNGMGADGKPAFNPEAKLRKAKVTEAQKTYLVAHPLQVLADSTQADINYQPYLTADYDLLAIARYHGGTCSAVSRKGCHAKSNELDGTEFDDLRGIISPEQLEIVEKLNEAVIANTGYKSGWVTHHGPENQYPKSPYVDYPILVFDPVTQESQTDAVAYLIRQGPPGFRDIHLKRFFSEKNREGFNLWPNPKSKAWRWEERQKFDLERGYDPRDVSDLPTYVEEAPRPGKRNVIPKKLGLAGFIDHKRRELAKTQLDKMRYKAWQKAELLMAARKASDRSEFWKHGTEEVSDKNDRREVSVIDGDYRIMDYKYLCSICDPNENSCELLYQLELDHAYEPNGEQTITTASYKLTSARKSRFGKFRAGVLMPMSKYEMEKMNSGSLNCLINSETGDHLSRNLGWNRST